MLILASITFEPNNFHSILADYQHSSPEEYVQPYAYTLPRRPLVPQPMERPRDPNAYVARPNFGNAASPFQRGNDVYWTLQTRRRPTPMNTFAAASRDDSKLLQPSLARPIEELYSTPNKIKSNELKTTPTGFAAYFSPIAKNNAAAVYSDDVDSSLKISPIDPRNSVPFKTSTPSKPNETSLSPTRASLSEELRYKLRLQHGGIRSHGNSPVSSGRSTPKNVLEAQPPRGRHSWASNSTEIGSETCSDRLGTPKTSLMDFKKLLLAHGSKPNVSQTNKLSAVELLKKSKTNPVVAKPVVPTPKTPVSSNLNILDLSGSPKTFATRRMIRQGNFGNSSPSKIGNSSKSRGVWRYNNMRSEVMSTAIPEVHSEEDNSSPSNSTSVSRSQSQSRNATPLASTNEINSPNEALEEHVLEEKISNIRENIFLQEDENNFMKCEVATLTQKIAPPATTRAQLQAQRAQFLSNNNHIKSATFKDGHYMGLSSFAATPPKINEVNYNEAGTNEDHQRHSPKPAAPSLETAL